MHAGMAAETILRRGGGILGEREEETVAREQLRVARKRVGDMLIASIGYRGRDKEWESIFRELRRQVAGQICGPAFCLYPDSPAEGVMEVECCFPVREAVRQGEVRSRVLEGGEVLSLTHRGSYGMLGESWGALFDYIEGNNIHVRGPRREIYTEGADGVELQVPLAEEAR